ncbi:Uncharacterised protein [Mycobacteroides abscessus subsp. abscessus]|nr:Uncharacterised protein [Mycobacteroides abscessus subsp. abscessus]
MLSSRLIWRSCASSRLNRENGSAPPASTTTRSGPVADCSGRGTTGCAISGVAAACRGGSGSPVTAGADSATGLEAGTSGSCSGIAEDSTGTDDESCSTCGVGRGSGATSALGPLTMRGACASDSATGPGTAIGSLADDESSAGSARRGGV